MNIKRSYLQLLSASALVGLFLANCTVKESSSDSCTKGDKTSGCACAGSVVGYQVCDADGVYGSCVCPSGSGTSGSGNAGGDATSTAGKSSSSAGKTSTEGGAGNSPEGGSPGAGTTTTTPGGDSAGGASPGGAGGAGGDSGIDPNDCESCLVVMCGDQLDACLADATCAQSQYPAVFSCIQDARMNGLVKRDAVRGCGFTLGAASDPNTVDLWAPDQMDPVLTDLMNCMATSHAVAPSADWADPSNPASFTDNGSTLTPTPWPADSCAKLSCTSKTM